VLGGRVGDSKERLLGRKSRYRGLRYILEGNEISFPGVFSLSSLSPISATSSISNKVARNSKGIMRS
jgi:hypothetical protein